MESDFERVAIVGAGLIGGSIALALEALGRPARLLDRGDDLRALANTELVILAAPVLENIQILARLRAHISPTTLITDTGSTKAAIVNAAAGMRFVGGHPIAGAAASGRDAARADLFAGRPWLLTPTPATDVNDTDRLRRLLERLDASVHLLTADDHDRLFALISHLPQLAVSALMDVVGAGAGADGLALAGTGLRDTTRLAASPPGIWRDIIQTNHAHIAPAIDALIDTLTRLRDDESGKELQAIFERAAAAQRRLGELDRRPPMKNGPL